MEEVCSRRGEADVAVEREEEGRGVGAGEARNGAQGTQVGFFSLFLEKLSSFFSHRISQHGLRRDEEGKKSVFERL